MNNRLLLMSSGLDSFIAWRLLDEPKAVYYAIGHPYEQIELVSLKRIYQNLLDTYGKTLDLEVLERLQLGDLQMADGHIPYRNLFFAVLAALDADTIYIGALAGETSRDKSWYFLSAVSKLLSYTESHPIKFSAPFKRYTKTQLVAEYLKKYPTEKDRDMLGLTRSCYSGYAMPEGVQGCGRCMACFRRWVAMENNGIYEKYLEDPSTWSVVQTNKTAMKDWWKYIANTDPREYIGLIRNNVDAWKALRLSRNKEA